MKKLLCAVVITFFTTVFSQLNAQTTFAGWLASFNTIKVGKKTSIHADIQLRSTDEIQQVQTLLIRSGLNVSVKKNLIITGGLAYIHNRRTVSGVSGYIPEYRVWEQLQFNHNLGNVLASHRLRIEQRFIGQSKVVNNELETDGTDYANRARYFFRGILPLKKQANFKKGAFLALQDEIFINFGNAAAVNNEVFDQNRVYFAAGYRLSSSFDLEAGYMNQYVNGRNGSFNNNHIIQLAGYMRL